MPKFYLAVALCVVMLAGCADPEVDLEGELTAPEPVRALVLFHEELDGGEREEIHRVVLGNGPFLQTVIVGEAPTTITVTATVGSVQDGCDGHELAATRTVSVDGDCQAAPFTLALKSVCSVSAGGGLQHRSEHFGQEGPRMRVHPGGTWEGQPRGLAHRAGGALAEAARHQLVLLKDERRANRGMVER